MNDKDYMPEAEVSIRTALFFIRNHITNETVKVSIDGAHVKTGNTEVFDIDSFLMENGCIKADGDGLRWQGIYNVDGSLGTIEITSRPGEGDVVIVMSSGKRLVVESKKGGGKKKGNQEYPLMREAIGQLMTNGCSGENTILGVAVPYTEKSFELASRWSNYELIRRCGIIFLLIKRDGNMIVIGG